MTADSLEVTVADANALAEAMGDYRKDFDLIERSAQLAVLRRKRARWFRPANLFLLFAALTGAPTDMGAVGQAMAGQRKVVDRSIKLVRIRIAS